MSKTVSATMHRVKAPCKPGYEGKWCVAQPHIGGVSFWYVNTKREALAMLASINGRSA